MVHMRVCLKCGTENRNDASFCYKCGTPFASQSPSTDEAESRNINYYYEIAIDGMRYQTRDRERAIDELKRLARKGSEEAKKKLMDISTDSMRVPNFLRERARDC
jgi:hypothetical protein